MDPLRHFIKRDKYSKNATFGERFLDIATLGGYRPGGGGIFNPTPEQAAQRREGAKQFGERFLDITTLGAYKPGGGGILNPTPEQAIRIATLGAIKAPPGVMDAGSRFIPSEGVKQAITRPLPWPTPGIPIRPPGWIPKPPITIQPKPPREGWINPKPPTPIPAIAPPPRDWRGYPTGDYNPITGEMRIRKGENIAGYSTATPGKLFMQQLTPEEKLLGVRRT